MGKTQCLLAWPLKWLFDLEVKGQGQTEVMMEHDTLADGDTPTCQRV